LLSLFHFALHLAQLHADAFALQSFARFVRRIGAAFSLFGLFRAAFIRVAHFRAGRLRTGGGWFRVEESETDFFKVGQSQLALLRGLQHCAETLVSALHCGDKVVHLRQFVEAADAHFPWQAILRRQLEAKYLQLADNFSVEQV